MDSNTIVVPSSASSIDSNDGPIEVSSDADSGGNTNRGGGRNTNTKKRTVASSVVSNHGPIALPSDDDDDSGGRNTKRSGVRNTSRGGVRNTNTKKKRTASSVVSNRGPVELLPSDDDDIVLDEATRNKMIAADRKRLRMGPIYTHWEFCDERIMLEELATVRRETGWVPSGAVLLRILEDKGCFLKRRDVTSEVIASKLYNLKMKFVNAINNGGPRNRSHDRKIYDLSKEVWTLEQLRREGKLI